MPALSRAQMRKVVVTSILHTDMSKHFAMVGAARRVCAASERAAVPNEVLHGA